MNIALIGSTGSIGRQSLEVIEHLGFQVAALTAGRNTALLEEQARRFKPKVVAMADEQAAADLSVKLKDTGIPVLAGEEGVTEAAEADDVDTVIMAAVGMAGLLPTLAAVKRGRRIALANKETLVCAGKLVMGEAKAHGAEIIPVDSEHSAIFQCLQGNQDQKQIKRLILTASGGPFFGMKRGELTKVTKKEALRHPNWSMGAKITVDSATLMNKGLELIEAMHLYQMPPEKIDIIVHRQSIVHSFVEYCDHSILAQMGVPDMKLPIQYALTYPQRIAALSSRLDLLSCSPLTFDRPDEETFECLKHAKDAAKSGGGATAVLNGANEAAVDLFLRDKIHFLQIPQLVQGALSHVSCTKEPGLSEIIEADRAARRWVYDHKVK